MRFCALAFSVFGTSQHGNLPPYEIVSASCKMTAMPAFAQLLAVLLDNHNAMREYFLAFLSAFESLTVLHGELWINRTIRSCVLVKFAMKFKCLMLRRAKMAEKHDKIGTVHTAGAPTSDEMYDFTTHCCISTQRSTDKF